MFGYGEAQQQQQQAQINSMIDQFIEQGRMTNPEDLEILLSLFGISMYESSSKGSGSGISFGDLFSTFRKFT
jgi:hypothetical protein